MVIFHSYVSLPEGTQNWFGPEQPPFHGQMSAPLCVTAGCTTAVDHRCSRRRSMVKSHVDKQPDFPLIFKTPVQIMIIRAIGLTGLHGYFSCFFSTLQVQGTQRGSRISLTGIQLQYPGR